ncbi:SagB family peptide dehydrogenase [Nocardia beijingensis]|uniref:SagB family peptide dehydrogenase n=1 Tax=Nocardia beijingensis TaxID=95162 RepID=UPI001893BAC5|nr:SagB family peptide dehydrogenase [Nocardia beijingensis]MBF6468642.1 SagB family peptide dehydrogenase [Nocardia beijingensis]
MTASAPGWTATDRPFAAELRERYSLRPGLSAGTKSEDMVALIAWPRIHPLPPGARARTGLLRTLADGAYTVDELTRVHGAEARAVLRSLWARGLLAVTVDWEGAPLYTMVPFDRPSAFHPRADDLELSRYTIVRRHHEHLVSENPTSWCDIRLHDSRIAALLLFPSPAGFPAPVADHVRTDLAWSKHLRPRIPEADPFSDEPPWSAHELWFHHRSSLTGRGWYAEAFAATTSAREQPVRPMPATDSSIELHAPDLLSLRELDITLTEALEDRRSCRRFDDAHPVTVTQLGELLFRAAGARDRTRTAPPGRPYPSGGAAYEIEIYLVAHAVTGIERGIYHYRPVDHTLCPITTGEHPALAQFLRPIGPTLGGATPQALLIIAAEDSVLRKYAQIGYSLMLRNAGVLTQNLYLVATALGLGALAWGPVDIAALAEATRRAPWQLCGIGSMVVGAAQRSRENPT